MSKIRPFYVSALAHEMAVLHQLELPLLMYTGQNARVREYVLN